MFCRFASQPASRQRLTAWCPHQKSAHLRRSPGFLEHDMPFAVLNVRSDQTDNLRLVRLLNRNIEIALEALHSRVRAMRPARRGPAGYIGTAMLLDLRPDVNDPRFMLAELAEVELFARPIDLSSEGQFFESAAWTMRETWHFTTIPPASENCCRPNLIESLRQDSPALPAAWPTNYKTQISRPARRA